MSLLQINVDAKLKKAIDKKAKMYGVPASSLVRIALVKSFSDEIPCAQHSHTHAGQAGNIFNAQRDNHGRGVHIDDLIDAL